MRSRRIESGRVEVGESVRSQEERSHGHKVLGDLLLLLFTRPLSRELLMVPGPSPKLCPDGKRLHALQNQMVQLRPPGN